MRRMRIRVFDRGAGVERYTVFVGRDAYLASANPGSPQGVWLYVGPSSYFNPKSLGVEIDPPKEILDWVAKTRRWL